MIFDPFQKQYIGHLLRLVLARVPVSLDRGDLSLYPVQGVCAFLHIEQLAVVFYRKNP